MTFDLTVISYIQHQKQRKQKKKRDSIKIKSFVKQKTISTE